MGTRCADHVTPLYPQKLALTSPTGGGRSVGIVRLRTKATEFSLVLVYWRLPVKNRSRFHLNITSQRREELDGNGTYFKLVNYFLKNVF